MPYEPVIACRGLQRHVAGRSRPVIDSLTFEVPRGTTTAIAGSSGSGKTLLLRCLALLDVASAGQILWHGNPVDRRQVPRFRSQVIYVHQQPALWEGTVEDNLRAPFSLHVHCRRSFNRSQIVDWLRAIDRSERLLQQSVAGLSGGERQLVALLRAVQLEPEVLLLDEPTAALDQESTKAVERLIGRWCTKNARAPLSIVLVTHDAQQAVRLAQRRFTMRSGRLQVEE